MHKTNKPLAPLARALLVMGMAWAADAHAALVSAGDLTNTVAKPVSHEATSIPASVGSVPGKAMSALDSIMTPTILELSQAQRAALLRRNQGSAANTANTAQSGQNAVPLVPALTPAAVLPIGVSPTQSALAPQSPRPVLIAIVGFDGNESITLRQGDVNSVVHVGDIVDGWKITHIDQGRLSLTSVASDAGKARKPPRQRTLGMGQTW